MKHGAKKRIVKTNTQPASKELYQAIFEQAADGIFIADGQGRYIEVNRRGCDMLGYSREEMLSLSWQDLIPAEDLVNDPLRLPDLHAGKTVRKERRMRCQDGRLLPVEINARMLSNGSLLGIVRDISERKQVEEALRASEARFRAVVENSFDGIQFANAQGTLFYVSPSSERVNGYDAQERLGGSGFDLVHPDHRAAVRNLYHELLKEPGTTLSGQYQIQHKDGSWRWVEVVAQNLLADPNVQAIVLTSRDITDRKRAEETLRESEERYRTLFEQAHDAIHVENEADEIVDVNRRACQLFGYSRSELLTKRVSDLQAPQVRGPAGNVVKNELARHGSISFETIDLRSDGALIPVEVSVSRVTRPQGNLYISIVRDITERKQAEEHIRRLSRLYATLSQVNQTIVRVKDRETLFQAICQIAIEFGQFGMAWIGLVEQETGSIIPVYAASAADNFTQVDFASQDGLFDREPLVPAFEEGQLVTYDDIGAIPDWPAWGETALKRGFHSAAVVPFTFKGEIIGGLSLYATSTEHFTVEEQSLLQEIGLDISFALDAIEAEVERQRATEALRESERQYHLLFDEMFSGFALHEIICDREGKPVDYRFLAVNAAFEKLTGLRSGEIIGKTVREVIPGVESHWIERYGRVALTGEPVQFEDYVTDLGKYYEVRSFCSEPGKFAVIFHDITERKWAEDALRESEASLKYSQQVAHVGHWTWDTRANQVTWSDEMYRIFGLSPDRFTGDLDKIIWEAIHPDDREKVIKSNNTVLTEQKPAPLEYRVVWPDQSIHTVWAVLSGKVIDDSGKILKLTGIVQDITERKRAEEAQAKLEEQLRQAQKMESIGRLAGGMAHDFNNILVVIIGYSDLLLQHLGADSPLYEEIAQIRRAGDRAAGLIRQLLAFSRTQILQPVILNLNQVVADLEKMLRRLIGEDIDLVIQLDPALRLVKADAGQIEQVILNLAVNARDAMPQGGQLTIETANVVFDEIQIPLDLAIPPGAYTLLAVRDTGEGMDRETRLHLFEPFFTTKEQGKGTGLGLAMVYGIVKQSGGDIRVDSQPGQGATFEIYLPASETSSADLATPQTQPVNHHGSETILLVEDEEMVRDLVQATLQNEGYTILETGQGSEALALLEQYQGPIDLLITDVVMPGMSGRELAEQLKALRPSIKVLFMSGYTDDAVVRYGLLRAEVEFLPKPFSPSSLASKVRQMLDKP